MNYNLSEFSPHLVSNKNLRSIGWLSFAIKLKKLIDKNNINLLNERKISTEIPKSNKKSETQSQPKINNKLKVQTNYEILGITRNATQKQIKSAYYSLSKTCHPDVNKTSEGELQFREITDAYEVLANKESKRLYDSTIANHFIERTKFQNSFDINQQNLNSYRDFSKFRNNFSDNEDYLSQNWKKRRTIRTENIYQNQSEKRYRYVDPLSCDPKDYFREHFSEDMQREYAEQIDKKNKEFEETNEKMRNEAKDLTLSLLTIIAFPILFLFCVEFFELNKPSNKKSVKNDINSKTKT